MEVRIKTGGTLQQTLRKMIVQGETKFVRLQSSDMTGRNVQKLLEYGLIRRVATPTGRPYSNCAEKTYKRRVKLHKHVTALYAERYLEKVEEVKQLVKDKQLDIKLGVVKIPELPDGPYVPSEPTPSEPRPILQGVKAVDYYVTKAGERVYKILARESRKMKKGYKMLLVDVPGDPYWLNYFTKITW